jgi:uncharacterized membrane protein YfcA
VAFTVFSQKVCIFKQCLNGLNSFANVRQHKNHQMEYLVVCLVALLGSGLTLFSGFGLGTILLPVFGFFFPIEVAIALTAIVHFLNNLFKLFLLGKHADKKTVLTFGIPSIIASLIGAWLLTVMSKSEPLYSYTLNDHVFYVTTIKLVIAAILIFFALFDVVPRLAALQIDPKYMVAGGLLSGFFGGLAGTQGALRSAFLIRAGLSKESFIATGVIIACLVDVTRLSVYSGQIFKTGNNINVLLVIAATLSAFLGAYIGNKTIKKITVKTLQYIVTAMLIIFGLLLAGGII